MRSLVYKFISIFLFLGSLCSLSSCQDREIVTTVSVNHLVTSSDGNSYKITSFEIIEKNLIISGNFNLKNYKFPALKLLYIETFTKDSNTGIIELNKEETNLLNSPFKIDESLSCEIELAFIFDISSLKKATYAIEIDFGISETNYDKTIFKVAVDLSRTE